jgi:hypothetical protein
VSTIEGRRRTVYEYCGVDAFPSHHAREIPHLVQWPALCEHDNYANETKGDEEVDCCFAEASKCLLDSYNRVSVTPLIQIEGLHLPIRR